MFYLRQSDLAAVFRRQRILQRFASGWEKFCVDLQALVERTGSFMDYIWDATVSYKRNKYECLQRSRNLACNSRENAEVKRSVLRAERVISQPDGEIQATPF